MPATERAAILSRAGALLLLLAAACGPHRPVRSMLELRQDGVAQQGWDRSGGAAALSTVLSESLGDPVSEQQIMAALLDGDAGRFRGRGGLSLLDLKRFATARGYVAAGYGNLELPDLGALGPAIVPIADRRGPHFVVFRGRLRGRAVLSDPAYGHRTLPLERFDALWTPRVAFVVARPGTPPTPGTRDGLAEAELARVAPLVGPRVVRSALSAAVMR